jgi:hypothetical protein
LFSLLLHLHLSELLRWDFRFSWWWVWRWQPSGILSCEVSLKLTDVSDVHTASSPWWWGQYISLKRQSTSMRLHGTISQKTVIFDSWGVW